jgi:hypothetical protein
MIRVNRAPVLTLWATVVAERLGFDRDAALTLGRAVAGSSAQMKGRALDIYEPSEEPPSKVAEERRERLKPDETLGVRLLGRTVPAIRSPDGIRAMEKDFRPASAASVGRYLASKFGDHLDEVRAAMEQLAASLSPEELNRRGFALYERFGPLFRLVPVAGVRRANSTSTGSSALLAVSGEDPLRQLLSPGFLPGGIERSLPLHHRPDVWQHRGERLPMPSGGESLDREMPVTPGGPA